MSRQNLERLLGLVLLLSTLYSYWYLLRCDFIHFDDPDYVTENYHVRVGLNLASLIWSFITFHSSNWHPLTWLSHMLDCDLYGLNPAGHHLTNLFFHLGNTLLLFLFLREATGEIWRSFLVAALFALHPLHVESVAWVSERKDVLSTSFWMLALVAYARYVRQPVVYRYALVLFLFALGLMAKPMVVTFPFVLMLMDFWPLSRLPFSKGAGNSGFEASDVSAAPISMSRVVLEKVPFLILSVLLSIVTVSAQSEGRAIVSLNAIPFDIRVANALVSYIRYLVSMLLPHDLTVFYPYPVNSPGPWLLLASAFLLVGLCAVAILQASRRPYFFVGWFWYLGTLVPVIGLVQVGDQAMADRYTYIPLVGLFVVFVWGLSDLFASCRVRRSFIVSFLCAICFVLIAGTRSQLRYWKNDETLFQHALRVNENNYVAHFILAQKERTGGSPDRAAFHTKKAVEISPGFVAKMHNRWGYYLAERGQLDEAINEFQEALQIRHDYANAHNNLAVALARKAQFDAAIEHFTMALQISPGDEKVLGSLRNAELERDRGRASSSNSE